ncbi:unannotated protein [freshwater metagenome]|uniref:Unannotated protein n=1 Tax=freshwater metagenome TaxID=449393 RepID=A0A6J7CR43_9ZZZZ
MACDLATAPFLAAARSHGVRAAAVLLVREGASGEPLDAEALEEGSRRLGDAGYAALAC